MMDFLRLLIKHQDEEKALVGLILSWIALIPTFILGDMAFAEKIAILVGSPSFVSIYFILIKLEYRYKLYFLSLFILMFEISGIFLDVYTSSPLENSRERYSLILSLLSFVIVLATAIGCMVAVYNSRNNSNESEPDPWSSISISWIQSPILKELAQLSVLKWIGITAAFFLAAVLIAVVFGLASQI